MDMNRNCIINVCFKRDSQFHKVDDLTVPDDDVRWDVSGGDFLHEGRHTESWVGQQYNVHLLRQEVTGEVICRMSLCLKLKCCSISHCSTHTLTHARVHVRTYT